MTGSEFVGESWTMDVANKKWIKMNKPVVPFETYYGTIGGKCVYGWTADGLWKMSVA